MSEITCPAALNIKGEHFPCQTMNDMAPGSTSHDGWAHSNRDAEALWCSDRDPIPSMPAREAFERDVLARAMRTSSPASAERDRKRRRRAGL